MKKVNCIIPAAGFSSRMKRWKPALPWKGSTLLQHAVDTALAAGCNVCVAGGHRHDELSALLNGIGSNCFIMESANWKQGMASTVSDALEMLDNRPFFVMPCDMPLIQTSDLITLMDVFLNKIIRPVYNDTPGHPVLLDTEYAVIFKEKKPRGNLRDFLNGGEVTLLPWSHSGVIEDIDTPEAYERFTRSSSS